MFGVFVNFRTVVISHTHIRRLFSLNGYLLEKMVVPEGLEPPMWNSRLKVCAFRR
jgi:hypothetical protein